MRRSDSMKERKKGEIKKKKVEKKLTKSKNGSGRTTYKVIIPKEWVEDMKVCEDDSIVLEYLESSKQISVTKKSKDEEK